MKIYRIRSFDEWESHSKKMGAEYVRRNELEEQINKKFMDASEKSHLEGFSYPAKKVVNFSIQKMGERINWRETLACPVSSLFNRIRACYHIFDIECQPYADDSIYIMEQTTQAYNFLKENYPNVTGSEFINENIESGTIIDNIRHEDITNLSFENESLRHILSFNVFEHVPDYLKGFEECYRVLCTGGSVLWTVPFIRQNRHNTVRATIECDGSIKHRLEPEYHGDPINSNGVLCFYHFGWELLSEVKKLGFKDVYACLFWSDTFGYLGPESIIFIAKK